MIPFPKRLIVGGKDKYENVIMETFKQVMINIPLLYVIKQVPLYPKLLKDLCVTKRRTQVEKKSFLTEQVICDTPIYN